MLKLLSGLVDELPVASADSIRVSSAKKSSGLEEVGVRISEPVPGESEVEAATLLLFCTLCLPGDLAQSEASVECESKGEEPKSDQ